MLRLEKEYLGFYLSGHPLDYYRQEVRDRQAILVTELSQQNTGTVRVAGAISNIKQKMTRRRQLMYTFLLEDALGAVECTVFPSAAPLVGDSIKENTCVIITGSLKRNVTDESERSEIVVQTIESLEAEPPPPDTVRLLVELIHLEQPRTYRQFLKLIRDNPGSNPLQLVAIHSHGVSLLESSMTLKYAGTIEETMRKFPGVSAQLIPTPKEEKNELAR